MAQLPRPAAAAAAAAAAWADALDVDDSDLRPCATTHPRSPHRRIPGPASAVQDAMRLRSPLTSSPAAARADGQAADSDFLLDAWLRALRDLGDDRAWQQPGIGAIRGERALDRACRVVAMVTLCTPNGFGDLVLNLKETLLCSLFNDLEQTLSFGCQTDYDLSFLESSNIILNKDPSGTIDASVHHKVLSEENLCKGLSVGSVIVLKQVAILRPSRTACYLNVTQKNVEKVLQKDSDSPCKQVASSSNTESQQPAAKCTETRRFACLGDKMGKAAGSETFEGTTSILSKISRTKDSWPVKLLSDNNGAANAAHAIENHHDIGLEEIDLSPPRKNVPGYNTSQQLQKIINSMNPSNCQLKQGGRSPKYGIRSEAGSSTDNIMKRLLGGPMMMPSSKEITFAEVSCHNRAKPDASNSTSRMDADARSSSEKHLEIGLQKMVEGLCSKSDKHQQQNTSANTTCSQPILGGSSVMPGSRDCTQASSTENLKRLSEDESVLPSSKRLKSDTVLSDGNGGRMNSNINTSSIDTETKYSLENSLDIGLDDIAEDFPGEHTSIRKLEHQQKDFHAANASTFQPTQENCSISSNSTSIGGTTLLPNSRKVVSVASVAQWTDDQLSELFADY